MSEWKKWTDKTPVSDEALLSHWGKLIRHVGGKVSRTYHLRDEDAEDITSDITLALLRLPQNKRSYEGYIRTVINNAARNSIISRMSRGATSARQWRDYATMSYADAAPSNDPYTEDDTDAIDRISPTVSPEAGWVTAITVDNALGCLTDREREIVRLYYFHDLTMKKIGERYGVSHASVSDTLKCAINKLRKSFRKTR